MVANRRNMSKNLIGTLLLGFLLVAGVVLLTAKFLSVPDNGPSKPVPLSDPDLPHDVILNPATVAGLDELSRMFGHAGFTDLSRRQLPQGMDPAEADGLLTPAIDRLRRTLAESNAGYEFVQPPPATGDDLFDRFTLALDEFIDAYGSSDIITGVPPVVPDSVLAGWEADFARDPRYWELRYISKLLGGLDWSKECGASKDEMIRCEVENRQTAVGFLHQAYKSGVASSDTKLLLYTEELYSGWLAERVCIAPGPVLSDDELSALLDECLADDPQDAWAWYLKSFSLFEHGNINDALAAMEQGNAQPAFLHPKPFPLPKLLSGLNQAVPQGGAVVAGAGLVLSRDFPITYNRMIHRDLSLTLSHIDETGDLSPLDTWHKFGCRFALCWPEDPLMPMLGLSYVSLVGEYMAGHTAKEGDPRRDVLKSMFSARNEARRSLEFCNDDSVLRDDLAVLGLVGGARGSCLAQYLQAERQARHLAAEVLPVINDIATVKYPELTDSAKLLAYAGPD